MMKWVEPKIIEVLEDGRFEKDAGGNGICSNCKAEE